MRLSMTVEGWRALWLRVSDHLTTAKREGPLRASAILLSRIREQFLTSGQAYGPGWLPLKKQPQHHPTLILTGQLMESFTAQWNSAGGIAITSTADYWRFSEEGTQHEPKRPVLSAELLGGIELSYGPNPTDTHSLAPQ